MVQVAKQMSIEIVHVSAPLATTVALPWIGITMETSVQEVEGLVRKNDVTMLALPLGNGHSRTIGMVR